MDKPRHTIAMSSVPPSIASDEVRAHVAHIDTFANDTAAIDRAIAWMTVDERARFDRFRHDPDRLMFALGRSMARSLVGRELGVAPDAWGWREGPHGRPEIAAPSTDLHFNVSHSAGLVVCALGRGRELGVDLENLQRRSPDTALVPRYCSAAEAADVAAQGDQWQERFLMYWTLKEAYLKARGLGISVPLADISFRLGDDGLASISFHGSLAGTDDRWRFQLQRCAPHHLMAIAASTATSGTPRVTVLPYE
jgi:4'-phosphopantetheinyl transferase